MKDTCFLAASDNLNDIRQRQVLEISKDAQANLTRLPLLFDGFVGLGPFDAEVNATRLVKLYGPPGRQGVRPVEVSLQSLRKLLPQQNFLWKSVWTGRKGIVFTILHVLKQIGEPL